MERTIIRQNPHWQGKTYSGFLPRVALLRLIGLLELKEIKVITGIRRSGKSSLMKLLINHLMQEVNPKAILFVNLEDPAFAPFWRNPTGITELLEKAAILTGVQPVYLFLDEVQQVEGWEHAVKSLYETETVKMVISGSNSRLMKSEYSKMLSGRYILTEVFPFSLFEIFDGAGLKDSLIKLENRSRVVELVSQVLRYGSFPEVFKASKPFLKEELLISYYDTIILKDCLQDRPVRDARLLRELAAYLLANFARPYSYQSLSRALSSNENSIREYTGILEDAFLLDQIHPFSFSLKALARARKKAYPADNGLIGVTGKKFPDDLGRSLENVVFTELIKSGKKEISYFHDKKECDFIYKTGSGFVPIQICYELTSENQAREITGLRSAMDHLSVDAGWIITMNQFLEPAPGIRVVPVWTEEWVA